MNQIDKLMALFDEAAEASFDQGLHRRTLDDAPEEKREVFKKALEAALKPGLPDGWVPCTITYEGQHPEEVAYGPQRLMDRLKKWLDKYFAMRVEEAALKPGLDRDALKRIAAACTDPDTTDALDALVATPPAQTPMRMSAPDERGYATFTATPPPRLTDDQIHEIYDQVAKQEPYSVAVTRRNVARAIETAVRKSWLYGITC